MNSLIAAFSIWLTVNMGVANVSTPNIDYLPPEKLAELYYGKPVSKDAALNIEAIYSDVTQTIYLRDDWDVDDLNDQSTLLHELVHHMQVINGIEHECLRQREHQAYELQMQWLREKGVEDPMALIGINMLMYVMVAGPNCHHTDMFEGH